MQAKLLRDSEGPNRSFDRRRPVTPSNCPHTVLPAGTVIDHPDSWRLCLPTLKVVDPKTHQVVEHEPPQAEPADEECKTVVEQVLGQRSATLQRRLQQRQQQLLDAQEPPKATTRRDRLKTSA